MDNYKEIITLFLLSGFVSEVAGQADNSAMNQSGISAKDIGAYVGIAILAFVMLSLAVKCCLKSDQTTDEEKGFNERCTPK